MLRKNTKKNQIDYKKHIMENEKQKIRVNIWQMGYTSFKDHLISDKSKASCKNMGFVILENKEDLWEETVWNLLNWSCWNFDKNNEPIKPDNVISPLDHCNSDIIINIEGSNEYKYAKHCGWGKANSLEDAEKKMKEDFCSFWPFSDVKRTSGSVKCDNGKVFQEINGKWTEVTW